MEIFHDVVVPPLIPVKRFFAVAERSLFRLSSLSQFPAFGQLSLGRVVLRMVLGVLIRRYKWGYWGGTGGVIEGGI